jgi:hypothetical protein
MILARSQTAEPQPRPYRGLRGCTRILAAVSTIGVFFKVCFSATAWLKNFRKKFFCDRTTIPQRLKPAVSSTTYDTAEAVPLQSRKREREFFRKL